MPRSRTQKQVARRIDIFYFRHDSALRNLRRVLICVCAIAAVVWIGVSAMGRSGARSNWLDPVSMTMIHNPGELAPSHAMFERQCETCHTGEKPGAYTAKVTDQACLHCHDGAIHDEHQFVADDPSKISRKTFTLAVNDPDHKPKPIRSAGCIHCHTEHRGQAALIGKEDRNCVVCHEDLNKARTTASENYAKVTGFAPDKHPKFGVFAKTSDGKWSDPPKLKFNHAFHFEQTDLKAVKDNCMVCHTTQPPVNVNPLTDEEGGGEDPLKKVPPYKEWSESEIANAKTAQGMYMRPVSYAAHCIKCHPMALPPEIGGHVVHADLATVTAQLTGLASQFKAKLAAMSEEDRKAALTITEGTGRKAKPKEITEDEYAANQLALFKSAVTDWSGTPVFTDANEEHLPGAFKTALTEKLAAEGPPDEFVLQSFAAYAMQDSCAKCHDIKAEAEGGGGRGRKAAGPPKLATEPTGLSQSQPKRWFMYSKFDHRPHRNLLCVDCHGAALKSGADKIINTTFARETASADVLLPDIETCAACHKPGSESVQAATGACSSCHVYHDRSKERPGNGPLMKAKEASPATQPTEGEKTASALR